VVSVITDRDTECSLRWCDETGYHATHRLYLESIRGRGRREGMVGVNLVRDDRRGADVRVEVTSSNAAQAPLSALHPDTAAELAKALASAVSRAQRLSHYGKDVTISHPVVASP
jgi:hypothetical protein